MPLPQTLTIVALVDHAAATHGDRVFIEDGAKTLTFRELQAGAAVASRAIIASGIAPGDRVAIQAPNLWEWVVAALGVHRAGGVLVPVNTRYKGLETAEILLRAQVRLLFTVEGFLGTDYVDQLRASAGGPVDGRPVRDLPALRRIVVLRDPSEFGPGAVPLAADVQLFDDFMAQADSVSAEVGAARAQAVGPDDLSDILFTSGTTGRAKGVMTTHSQNLRAFHSWSSVVGLSAEDRYLVVNPFFHAFGYKAGWLAALMCGSVLLPHPVFDPDAVLARIAVDRITMLPGPPALFQRLLAHPERGHHDLTSLRLAVTGAAVIPVELIERMRSDLGFETVITGYGLTEVCGIATMCRFDDDPITIASTSGRAIDDVEVVVTDPTGVPNLGKPGEVKVRGYNVMRGYLDDPEATKATIDEHGWLATGDIGVMDDRGNLRITDRKKDMFIMGGFNCYPAEIERLMLANEEWAQVAVIGVPDDKMGEVGMAFVVPKDSATTPEDVRAWCRANLANFKVPRHISVETSLPMNATGKVLKFELRARAAKG